MKKQTNKQNKIPNIVKNIMKDKDFQKRFWTDRVVKGR